MSFFSHLRVEVKRIFLSRITWLIMALSVLTPLGGYSFYQAATPWTTASRLLANPVLAGGLASAVLFALLTLFELDRVHKNLTAPLTDTIVSPLLLNVARLLAVIAVATVTTLLTAIAYLPYTAWQMSGIFDLEVYLNCYFLLLLPSLWLAILAAATFYQIIGRIDLSFVLFVVFVMLSLSQWFADDYILRWVNPLVPILSDDFSNAQVFRTAAYNRLFWFSMLSGAWLLSMLCVRKYNKGLFGSFAHNGRRIYLPILSAVLIASACYAYHVQPYVDHSPMEFIDTDSKSNENLALSNTKLDISFNTGRGTLSGTVIYHIQNTSTAPQECRLALNPGYTVSRIAANGENIAFVDLNDDCNFRKHIVFDLPAQQKIELSVTYSGGPQIWAAMRNTLGGGEHIDDKFIYLRGTDLVPRMQIPWAQNGTEITGRFTIPKDLTLIATGDTLKLLSENDNGTKTWLAHDNSHGVTIFAGDYVMLEIDGGDMPVEFYYSRKHQAVMEELGAQEVMEDTIAYCTAHYGSLPFTSGRPFKIIQNSAFMFGGAAFDNISTMGECYFSDANLNDKQNGATRAEVLAHEIVHQWWGLSAQCMDMENADWTDEGVTVYTTYRMMKEKYGEEYAQKSYVDVWKEAVENQKRNFYNRHPEYLDILPEKYAAQLRTGNISTGMYCSMPLSIYNAVELVGGEDKMDEILAGLYQNGGTEMLPYTYITYNDFLNACGLSKEELSLD